MSEKSYFRVSDNTIEVTSKNEELTVLTTSLNKCLKPIITKKLPEKGDEGGGG